MTNHHWYDDSKMKGGGQEEEAVTENPAIIPVMSFDYMLSYLLYVWFFYYQRLDLVNFFNYVEWDAANCAALETLCVKSMTAVPFINTAYQQPVGLPTRGHKSLPEWHSYRTYEQQHRKNNPPHAVQRVRLSCKVDRKREHLSWPLCVCAWTRPQFYLRGYDEQQLKPGWLLPGLFLLHAIILPQFRETGLMCKQMQQKKLAMGHLTGMIRTPHH